MEPLQLRRPRQDDLPFVVELFARPELVAHRPVPQPDTPAQGAARLARDIAHWQQHGFGRWVAQVGDRPIGFGGVTLSEAFEGLNLSYHLHPDAWGRGYASELVRRALSLAFDELAAERVIGLVRPVNHASRRVLERCGFEFERDVMLHGAPTQLFARRRLDRDRSNASLPVSSAGTPTHKGG